MDVWEIGRAVDLKKIETACMYSERLYAQSGSAKALRLSYHVFRGAAEANLAGATVLAYGKRADGQVAVSQGTVSGSSVSATLGEDFFAVTGDVDVSVVLTAGETTCTLAQILIRVTAAPDGAIVDPGEEMPGLAEGLEAIGQLPGLGVTRAEVPGIVAVTIVDAAQNLYRADFADGTAYMLSADGEDVEVWEADEE